ncbi:alkaline phosphatase family protein [sulfur-oxidizing endosymbiont of Gigantopelta aegis]|uniref:alkaline phosphatase family protein n=1 Tax=sulfur-oxidizing endosymbiont of Gigantopelta aegis TaxID=2794934 RepID=UPI0018DDD35A|nr:alkaline phosphatase family protein [sulfur-oxidizing endosymbiont of Gigantopelta aegis]
MDSSKNIIVLNKQNIAHQFLLNVLSIFCFISLISLTTTVFANPPSKKPKLILQITVDQLRGDLPDKYMKNMGQGGFRYLKNNGLWYNNAHYGHSNTETVVGHTSLATGADPAEHGMVSNVWFDRQTGKLAYNIEDSRYHILSKNADIDKSTEVDASQALASTDGRSPANIMVTTFSDELSLSSNGKAKIFAVSVKDRGAVTLAGHHGKAFWFSKSAGEFITSSYYYLQYPEWVISWNQQQKPHAYSGKSWELVNKQSPQLYVNKDNQAGEVDLAGFGRTFPHAYGKSDHKNFNNYLTFSPAGDELTLDFAKTIIAEEQLGQDDITDFLAISFSSTDYIGHIFGPSSREAEDNMLHLDRTLKDLFAYVDKHIGLENTLIVLSADHGGPETPAHWNSYGIESNYVSPNTWDKAPAIAALKKRFGIGQKLIKSFFPPYLYLDHAVIKQKGLNLSEVETAIANELMGIKGVALAISSNALSTNELPDTFLHRAALRNYHKKRSGDILIIFQPQYFINDFDNEHVAANHGGPWNYDTFVPVIFAGGKITAQRINRKIQPIDIAPTLAKIMKTNSPSGASGIPLKEVILLQHIFSLLQ